MSQASSASGAGGRSTSASRPGRAFRAKLVDLWRARELLRQFVAKELKVRYKNSVLGFVWSLLTPALMTVVFSVIFATVLRIPVDDFAAFFLPGYLAWQFFQNSVQGSISAVVGNGALIKKVYFPREILPLSIVLSQVVHFLLALLAVSPYLMWVRGWQPILLHLPAVLFGVVVLTVFTSGVAMLLAGANVPFRDLQELIVVMMMVWFYATPVIYPLALVANIPSTVGRLASAVISWNPMTWFIRLFREPLYGEVVANPAFDDSCEVLSRCAEQFLTASQSWPSLQLAVVTAAVALGTFLVSYAMFHRFSLSFAKEI